ncbi:TetR/AcrR family transcriptional regulator [Streptacidiphilus rugosus]|uniref:TetR/AcrR family transcriptional regulator n=1 Tax=Streptacidiphilus rugosus TaxID=405783 RepID=UPI0018DD3B89|nr:TetR/AcrR family transcriptional regulator [Streptacidiphilus rugosus]
MKQERARRTRESILDAAAHEFASHGYERTTLKAVADRMKMSKGALYGHFTCKDELAEEMIRQAGQTWLLIRESAGAPGNPWHVALRSLVTGLAWCSQEDIRFGAALRLLGDRSTDVASPSGFVAELQQTLAEELVRAQRSGGLPDWPPAQGLARLVVALVVGGRRSGEGGAAKTTAEDVALLWDMVESLARMPARGL